MKRLTAWVAGAVGGLAAYRAVKRPRPLPETSADARAEELKARLQRAREVQEDRDGGPAGAARPDPGDLDPVDLDPAGLDPGARRAQVHEQGRAALDEMRGDKPS